MFEFRFSSKSNYLCFERFFLVLYAKGFVKKGFLDLKLLRQLYWWVFGILFFQDPGHLIVYAFPSLTGLK